MRDGTDSKHHLGSHTSLQRVHREVLIEVRGLTSACARTSATARGDWCATCFGVSACARSWLQWFHARTRATTNTTVVTFNLTIEDAVARCPACELIGGRRGAKKPSR